MPITDEQANAVKKQLLSQINKLPENQKAQTEKYILSMSNSQVEDFIKKNKLISEEKPKKDECLFCLLSKKQIESFAIYEDKNYLVALEINPFTKGHSILIPKKHIIEEKALPSTAFTIANRVGKHIIKKLGAESFQINTSADLKHAIISIIPLYKNQPLDYEKKPAKKQELQETAIKIGEIKKRERKKKSADERIKINRKKAEKAIVQIARRIP